MSHSRIARDIDTALHGGFSPRRLCGVEQVTRLRVTKGSGTTAPNPGGGPWDDL